MKKIKIILNLVITLLFFTNSYTQTKIPEDKALHMTAGFGVSMTSYVIFYDITKDKHKAFIYSLASSILAGTLKELYDLKVGGEFDVNDIIYTSAGGMSATLTLDLFNNYKKKEKKDKRQK